MALRVSNCPVQCMARSISSPAASSPATCPAAAHSDLEFERCETLWLLFHVLRPGAAFARIEHIHDIAVRIDGRRSAHWAAEKLLERFIEDLSG
jgi:hypothetical protein